MLLLSRRETESIVINGDVHVVVLGIQGNKVRLGIQAPKHVSIHRMEISHNVNQESLSPLGPTEASSNFQRRSA